MGNHLRSTILFAALLTVGAGVKFTAAEAVPLADLIANNGTLTVESLRFSHFTCSSSLFGSPCPVDVSTNTVFLPSGGGLFFVTGLGAQAGRPGEEDIKSVQVGYWVDVLDEGSAISAQQTTMDAAFRGSAASVTVVAGCGIIFVSCVFTLPTPLSHFETGWFGEVRAIYNCEPNPLPSCPPVAILRGVQQIFEEVQVTVAEPSFLYEILAAAGITGHAWRKRRRK